jgi:4-amino-4-deoxy-L-arabinose transferase-like glycosyltransferase
VIALAALMRLPSLLHDGLFRDEANAYVIVSAPSFADFLHRITAMESHPPLYFLIVYFWIKAVGAGELAFKGLPYFFSLITVPAIFRLGKTLDSSRVGLLAAGMYAVSPLAVNYSTMLLYPLTGFLFILLACLLASARKEQPTAIRYTALALVTTLALYTHYSALLYVPVLAAWALTSPRGVQHGAALVLVMLAGSLPFAFWFPVFLHQQHVGLPPWQPAASLSERAAFALASVVLLVPVPMRLPEWPIFIAIIIAGLFFTRRTILTSPAAAMGAVFLILVFLVSAAGLMRIRYVLPAYGLQCVFLAWIVSQSWDVVRRADSVRWQRWGIATAITLLLALFVFSDFDAALANSAVPRSGIRTFAAEGLQDDTLYLVAPDYLAPTFAYYARSLPLTFLGFARVEHPEVLTLDGYRRLWNAPEAVDDALNAVARAAPRYQNLDVIVDQNARNEGRMPYGKTWILLEQLKRRYRLLGARRFPGVWEPITVYRFAV